METEFMTALLPISVYRSFYKWLVHIENAVVGAGGFG
jgi:hypothetical protein